MACVLLTGATGFLGREILWRLLARGREPVECLVRAEDDAAAAARLEEVLAGAPPGALSAEARSRARALRGDLEIEGLGLEPTVAAELERRLTRVVHGAASVRFDLPLAEARRVNVDGTRRVLDLAARSVVLERFDYVGTAYVAGRRAGRIGEDDLDGKAGFHNSYEQTKYEAERLVRERRADLPIAIFRPSIVVGDSETGRAASFKVLYWPLQMISRGLILIAPARRTGVVDLVPVDYVCDALEAISADPASRGGSFHLTAGEEASATVGEILELAVGFFGVRRPLLVDPATFYAGIRPLVYAFAWGRRRQVLRRGRVYVPYLSHRARFDVSRSRAACDLRPPQVATYFRRLMEYAVETDWGRGG